MRKTPEKAVLSCPKRILKRPTCFRPVLLTTVGALFIGLTAAVFGLGTHSVRAAMLLIGVTETSFIEPNHEEKIFSDLGIASKKDGSNAAVSSGGAVPCGTPGTLDPSFGTGGKVVTTIGEGSAGAHAAVLQPDGKLVIAGTSEPILHSGLEFTLVRYNPDGSLDNGFGTGGISTTSIAIFDTITAVTVQSDGKIIAAGRSQSGGGEDFALARYNTNGTLDTSFGTGGVVITDFGDTDSEYPSHVKVQPDGKIIVTGITDDEFAMARYGPDGTLDTIFGSGGKVITSFLASSTALALQDDGKILIAASYTGMKVVRYNPDGTMDNSFASAGQANFPHLRAWDLSVQPDGRILVAGQSEHEFGVARLNSDGTLDTSFGSGGSSTAGLGVNSVVLSMALLPDGRIVAAGHESANIGHVTDFATVRYNANGTLDTSFGTGGKVMTSMGPGDDLASALVLQPDGRVVVGGHSGTLDTFSKYAVARYFGNSCSAEITVSEGLTYRTDGDSLEFGTGNVGSPFPSRTFTIRNDGSEPLTLGAITSDGPNSGDLAINTAGTAATLAPGASTIFSVTFTPSGPGARTVVLRIPSNDPDEPSFDLELKGRGLSGVNYTLSVSSLRGTVTSSPAGIACPEDCTETFDEGEEAVMTLTAVPHPGYRFIGWSGNASGSANPLPVAVDANKSISAVYLPIPRFDYDGDGRSDLSVFRPSNNTWYRQSLNAYSLNQFGEAGDKIAPADYDGDGTTDIAVFRPSVGRWFYVRSADMTFTVVDFGQEGDIPAPMDINGDSRFTIAVYRRTVGRFFYIGGQPNPGGLGYNSVPVVGDYNGDGKSDLSTYGPLTHVWTIHRSSGTPLIRQWGEDGDVPVPADYDGDGATDIAVWRPSTGRWYIIGSSWGWMTWNVWGEEGDIPVPADYDGDGRADIAIWRPLNATWYIVYSSTNDIYTRQFGAAGDIPTPSAFIY